MNIVNVVGNAVTALKNQEIQVLMHCTNCQGVMGSGIALEIANEFPHVKTFDSFLCKGAEQPNKTNTMLGRNSVIVLTPFTSVINLYGQQYPGFPQPRPLNYGALAQALFTIPNGSLKDMIVGIPHMMASDRAGGDWITVMEIVIQALRHNRVKELRIYKLPDGETRNRRY